MTEKKKKSFKTLSRREKQGKVGVVGEIHYFLDIANSCLYIYKNEGKLFISTDYI